MARSPVDPGKSGGKSGRITFSTVTTRVHSVKDGPTAPTVPTPDSARQALGKVYEQITSANPRLLKKYNYRVVWADTAKGPTSLRVENYAHGSDAALDSWVVLERKEGGAGGAE